MTQVIRVYNTEANAIAGGTTGMITAQTVDLNAGAIANLHDDNDDIPYFIYEKYYYRIDANEPVAEFHIDWDDGEDNSPEKRNIQVIKLDNPRFYCVVSHIYTEACTEAKKFFPMIRVKNIDGYLSKWYTNDASENMAHASTKALETFSASLGNDQNGASVLSFEKAEADKIPHFCPSNTPPVCVLKTDRKRILGGINNRAISNIEAGGTTYPLLYAVTDGSTTAVSVKLTVQGKNDRAVREYTLDEIVDADADINTASEIQKYCVPYNASSGPSLDDSAETLLRAELLKGTVLADNERVYIKVFNAKNDLTLNIDVSADDCVCILSNGNPIIDLNDPVTNVNVDTSESFTKASNLTINNVFIDDDNLHNATIQSQASISSKQGQHTDLFHANLAVTATDDVYNNTQLSYTHNNFGHLLDSDSRFHDCYRLVRAQVADNYALPTGMGDIANRRSTVEHYDDDQYRSTINSGGLKILGRDQRRGLILFSNDDDVEQAFWQDLTALSRTDGIMIGGSGDYILRHGANVTQSTTHTRTPHPKNHLLICKDRIFDRIYFRMDNTYSVGTTPIEIDVSAFYAHKNGWKALEIEDSTLGLKTSGSIKFKKPLDWKRVQTSGIESGNWSGPVPASSSEETAEVTRITLNSDDKGRYDGKHVLLTAGSGVDSTTEARRTAFWFDSTNGTSQPTVSGADVYVEAAIHGGSTHDDYATVLRDLIHASDDFSCSAVDTSGADAFFDVTNVVVGTATDAATNIADGGVSVTTQGVSNVNDPSALWDFNAYGVLISFNVKASITKVIVKNVWTYNNTHSQLIKLVDGHHLSLNNIAIAQSISFNRNGKYVNMEDRFGKTEIKKLGAAGGTITFGSVDLGDVDNKGNRKKIKRYQQNATPVYLDVTHKSGEKTRFYGVIVSMSEDHPVGEQFPKYGVKMQVSYVIEMQSDGTFLSDKISIGGNIDGTRKYISTT